MMEPLRVRRLMSMSYLHGATLRRNCWSSWALRRDDGMTEKTCGMAEREQIKKQAPSRAEPNRSKRSGQLQAR